MSHYKLISILLISTYFRTSSARCSQNFRLDVCAQQCPTAYENKLYFTCCNVLEKYGECPSSETPTYDHTFDLTELECCSDLDCPDSYKCCKEADYEKPYYSLCKPPIFTYASEDEKQSFDEPVHSGEGDTLTEDDTEIDFVSSYRDDSGSGSGSGSGSKEYSHEFGSQDMTHYDEEIKKEYGFDGSQNWKPGSGSGKEIDGSGSGDNSNENVESLSNDKEPIDYATDDFSFA